MVNNLTSIRQEVADVLTEAGIKATSYVNENFVPPIAIVIPADPYVSMGDVFGSYTVSLQVLVIGGKGTNKTASENLDSLIEAVLVAIGPDAVSEVGQPGEVSVKGNTYLAAVLSLEVTTHFKEVN